MAKQEQSRQEFPREEKDRDRPSAARPDDGSRKIGLNSDEQPGLVAPSGVNQRGAGSDQPTGGGPLNFDDGDMAHPYGNVTRNGRTWDDKEPSDAGELGTPDVGMSDHNGPSDPDAKRSR